MSRTNIDPSLTPNVLPKSGGTMSGNIAMGTNKITGLANGTASTDAAAIGQITGFTGTYGRGIKVSWINTTTNHLLWNDAILADASGNLIRNNAPGSIVTMVITNAGVVNGLDAGSVAANKWYYIYLISDGANFKGLYSLSATSPTMPGAYTYKLLVGTVLTDSSGYIISSLQIGQRVEWLVPTADVNDSSHNNSIQHQATLVYVPPSLSWKLDIQFFQVAAYSSGSTHEFSAQCGYDPSTPTLIGDYQLYINTNLAFYTNATINITSEPDPGFYWLAYYHATNLSSYHTYIYVLAYYLTELPIE